jgi:hypothetical protein
LQETRTKLLLVIDHFEVLAAVKNQQFLYSVLDMTRRLACFVLLVGSQEVGIFGIWACKF